MFLYILNRSEEVVAVLSNEGESNFLSSAVMKEELNSIKTLDVEVSTLAPEVAELKEENYVLFQDISDNWHMFIIKEMSEIHGSEVLKTAYCEDSSQELLDYVFESEFVGTSGTAQSFLSNALSGTRWQVGTVDVASTDSFPTEVKYKSVLEVVHEIRKHWNLQIRFRIQVAGNKIVGRYVDLKKHVGVNVGKRFEYTKDIVQVERTVQSTDLKTAIIPIGGSPEKDSSETPLKNNFQKESDSEEELPPIDITGVEWTTPTNPVNKPLGQNYVEIVEATEQWGYLGENGKKKPRFIFYENSEITSPAELIADAYKVLKDISKPITNYKLDVLDLFALTGDYELSYESVNIGDIVTVIDHEFTPALALRTSIISKETDLLQAENSSIELGSFIRNLVDSNSSDRIQNMIDSTVSSGVGGLESSINSDLKELESALNTGLDGLEASVKDITNDFDLFQKNYSSQEVDFNLLRNSDFRNNMKYWVDDAGTWFEDAEGIPYFKKCVAVYSNSWIMQNFLYEDSVDLIDNNLTLSAFVKGAGILSAVITYKTSGDYSEIISIDSKPVYSDNWQRVSFTFAIKSADLKGKEITEIGFRFRSEQSYTSLVTGFMLNFGNIAGKYKTHVADKIGKGVYEQIKDINNKEFASGIGYVYLEEEDGLWVYDKPSGERPMKMTALKGGMLGIGTWNLQTQQWDINTFIDGNMVNASCINTGVLNADLIKTGTITSLDGSVSINMNDGTFKMGGSSGDSTEITNNKIKVSHSDGSYSQMTSEGFMWHKGSTKNEYHHLLYAGEYTCLSEETVRINLPSEFRGKPFKVVTSIKRVSIFYDLYSVQAPLISFYAHADTLNQSQGWIEIYASIRAWDKNDIAEGVIIGDHSADKHLIKPTVAYWVFV